MINCYDINEGDEVIITTGKLDSHYGYVVLITHYQTRPTKALVRTLDENNKETYRTYNLSNLMKA